MPTLAELIKILEQLPAEEEDVFNMMTDYEPKPDYDYLPHTEGKRPNTVVVSLDKRKYNVEEARARAEELFILRGLKPYRSFATVRYFVWYTVPV